MKTVFIALFTLVTIVGVIGVYLILREARDTTPTTWTNGDSLQAPSLPFPDGTPMRLEPSFTLSDTVDHQIMLYSPQEDGRYKMLCTTKDKCLPLEDVMAHINQHGKKRKER